MRGPLLIVAGVLATSQPAWAKYDPCGYGSVLEPTGRVPRNAKVWLWRGGGYPLRIRGADLDRAVVPPFVVGSSRGLAMFDPGLLEGDGTYRLAIVNGHHEWTLGEFETGDDIDDLPPGPPRFHGLAITQMLDPSRTYKGDGFDGFDGFGVPASDIAAALDVSDDTVALDVAFDDSTEHFIMPPDAPGLFGRNRCGPGRQFRVGASICMSIRAIDLAGNFSDATMRCTTVRGRIGDTARTAREYEWPTRRHRRSHRPDERPEVLGLAVLAAWLSGWLASRRIASRGTAAPTLLRY